MPEKTIFSEMWDSYKKVVIKSLVTTFGLDFIVKDRIGGDVDTIHNVRNGVAWKNPVNEQNYNNRGDYDSMAYHGGNEFYRETIKEVRHKGFFDDEYSPGNRIAYGKQSYLKNNPNSQASLDHMLAAKMIHDDPGRTLAGKDGPSLANTKENLYFTNASLNSSLRDTDKSEFIAKQEESGKPLSEESKRAILEKEKIAREAYERKLNEYYLSPSFYKDVTIAASKVGVAMGIRQAIGFMFVEIWFACEDEMKRLPVNSKIGDCFNAIKIGISNGANNIKKKYPILFNQFKEGFVAGVLASVTTTIINIFFTTSVLKVKLIRQLFITVVQTGNILLINPENYYLGDQIRYATAALVTGVSGAVGIVAGTVIGNLIAPVDAMLLGSIRLFTSTLVSGLLSCTVLLLIDRSEFIRKIVERLNGYGYENSDIRYLSREFRKLAGEIENVDLDGYEKQIEALSVASQIIKDSQNDEELNKNLKQYFKDIGLKMPWDGDFDSFMSNRNNHLKFE